MLGILVEAEADQGGGRIFHKFGAKTALERVLQNCLGCLYAHKVILCMPAADSVLINGSVFQSRLAGSLDTIEHHGRKIKQFYYGRQSDRDERLYRAAVEHGLDDILLVSATNILLPSWMLNYAAAEYLKFSPTRHLKCDGYPAEVRVECLPFHSLASLMVEVETGRRLFSPVAVEQLRNEPPFDLPLHSMGEFSLNNHELLPVISRIVDELDLGADLGDLLEDFVEQENA